MSYFRSISLMGIFATGTSAYTTDVISPKPHLFSENLSILKKGSQAYFAGEAHYSPLKKGLGNFLGDPETLRKLLGATYSLLIHNQITNQYQFGHSKHSSS